MTVLVVVVAGVIAVVLVIKVMWGRRRRREVTNNNDDVQEIEMGAVGGQPAVVAVPIAGAGADASGGATPRRIPATFRPTLNSKRFGRKKVEVAQGKKNYIQLLLSCF